VIPKISRGSDIGGLVRYLVDVDPDRTKNVHVDPHLVAGSPGVEARWLGRDLRLEDGRKIGAELDGPRRAYRTKVAGGDVWHCSLSLRADEGRLSDAKWAEIAREFVEGMGFDGPGVDRADRCRWAFIRHGVSQAGNDHGHLAVSLVRESGAPFRLSFDRKRAQRVARELEARHGLVQVRETGRATRGVSRVELERQKRMGAAEPERRTLARVVRAAAVQAGSEAEFVRLLRGSGVRVAPWFAKGGRDAVAGYRVAARPESGRSAVWFGGGKLAPDLSLPRLRRAQGWPSDPVSAAAVAEVWRAPEQVTRRGRPVVVPEAVWRQRGSEVAALRGWLSTLPAEDPRWVAGAGELAGVFASWAGSVEGGRPGPLSAAADRLAHVAAVRAHAAPERPVEMPSGRGAARLVASAARGGQGSVAQLALLAQLRDASTAIADAGQATQVARQAARAAEEARAQLTVPGNRRAPQPAGSGRSWGRG
jgi:hypothetical protein